MKRWSDIDPGHGILEIKGNAEMALQGIAFDSRKVAPGFLFVAQKGIHTDGHLYIASAIERGASAVVCEELPSSLPENVLFIKVDNA
ncbi:MAG TPA: Mur ligase domain-containing protein, partial [Prolixibacteraceae bacterium]|nr:Mur ligase domain-containing protein [Prolixibacteraceae bacterium]